MKSSGIIKKVFNNFGWKFASLILAIVIWGIIQGDQTMEVESELALQIVTPKGKMVRGERVRTKAVTLRGQRVMMLEAPSVIEGTVVVPEGKFGRYRTRISAQNIKGLNPRIHVTIHEPFLNLYIGNRATRRFPVKEVLQGTPADGYFIKKVTVNPKYVSVTGIRSDLLKIKQIVTEPIELDSIKETQSFDMPLLPPPIDGAELSISSASVSLQVAQRTDNRRYGSIPIEIEGSDYFATVRPKYTAIVIQGTKGILDFVNRTDLKAFVDARNLRPGRYEQEIKVKIPPDTVLIETTPEKVTVHIHKRKKSR